MRCSLQQARMSFFSMLRGVGGELGLFVGRQSVTLARSGLCSVVSSVGGVLSMLVMWLISFLVFILRSGVSCCVRGIVVCSLARRLRSVTLLRSVLTSLWTVFFPVAASGHVCGARGCGFGGKERCCDSESFR